MKRNSILRILWLLVIVMFTAPSAIGQYGPMGIGNSDGSSGQPKLIFWLDGSSASGSNGQLVSTWNDRSGNDNHFNSTGTDRPIKRTNGPEGKAYLEFDNDKMVRPNLDFPTDGFSIYIVYRSNDSDYGLFSYAQDNSNPMAAVIRDFSGHDFIVDSNFFDAPIPGLANGNWRLAGYVWDNSSNPTRFFWDHGSCEATSSGVHNGVTVGSGGTAVIGQIQHALDGGYDVTEAFQGDIAEIFLYEGKVNKAETRMMTTYIESRYQAVNVTGGWDKFNTSDPYRERVVGIGRDNGSGSEHLEGRSDGLVLRANPGGFNGSYAYLSAAHDEQEETLTSITSSNVSSPVEARWDRDWLIKKDGWGGGTSVFVAFDFGEGIGGEFPLNIDNYRLLRWNGSNYVPVSVVDQFVQDDEVVFRVNTSFSNGRYTIGTTDQVLSPLDGQESRTWYAYQSGNWNDPGIWTLDGSAAPYYYNPESAIPASGDIVVINSGRTVTSNVNNINLLELRCRGVLDFAQTSGHSVGTLIGNGRVRCAGSGGQDNFPTGNTSPFADPVNGGVLEFYGSTGFDLTKSLEVNDLVVDMASSSDVIAVKGNQTINGDFNINRGNWQFNHGSGRTVVTHGDVFVESNGLISTAGSNVQHTWTFYGDLRNLGGDVRFTERTTPDYNDNNGTAWVNCRFVHDSKNQEIVCNGISWFQRIVMDKGTDDTYLLSIEASNSNYFKLLGRANDSMGSDPYQTENENSNCLAIINGTAEIRDNVFIPLHTGGGNYNINETAGLWVNGGEVTKGVPIGQNNQAIVAYGKIRISAGTLNANCTSGITMRNLGSVEISGGTLRANQIRTSVFGPENIGSVSLSGGLIDIDGTRPGGSNGGYYVFSLTYPGNVFEMTGGELRVAGANGSGLIFINSDPENISVTGGEVVAQVVSSSGNYRVTSRAPFWNFTVENPSTPSEKVEVTGGNSDGNPIPDLPLIVKNKITLESGATLDMNNLDLFVGGDLEFVNGATYEHGSNRTVFDGPGSSQLDFGNTTLWPFNDFVIEKDQSNREVEIVAGDGSATVEIENLEVLSGEFILNSYEAFVNGDVINNGTVGQEDDTGALHFKGTTEQSINAAGGVFYKVNLDNSAGAVLETGQMTIRDNFNFSSGNLNVGSNDLRLEGENATITGYDSDEMVLCDGGGIEHYVKQNGQQITYPLGTLDGATPKYTPAILKVNSFSDDGYVRIAPVADTLDLAAPPGSPDILGYYWAVSHSGFGSLPSVAYRFDYDQTDVGGNEANYDAGKVLNEPNFTRQFISGNVNTTSNEIFINNGSGQNLSGGIPIENAFYSAGHQDRFTGQIRVYYSRNASEGATWTNPSNWNRSDMLIDVNSPGSVGPEDWHSVSQTPSTDVPGPGDLVYIGFTPHDDPGGGVPHSYSAPGGGIESVAVKFTPYTDAAGNPTSEYSGGSTTQRRPTLRVSSTTDLGNLNRISGEGCLLVDEFDVDFTGVDLNDFLAQDSSIVFYTTTAGSGSPRVIQNVPSNVPNLYVTANASGFRYLTFTKSVSVRNNLKLEDGGGLILNGGASGDIAVQNDLLLREFNGANGGGRLFYPNGNNRTVSVRGDIRLEGNGSLIDIASPNSPAADHVLRLEGDIYQNTSGTSGLALYNGANNDYITLELAGSGNNEFTNDGGPTPSLYRMVVDKGTGISSGFTFNTDINLNGPTNQPDKAIALRNGLLTLNDTGININLSSGGGDFTIPASSGLQLDAGFLNITGTSTGMILDGLLRMNGGQISIDDGNEGSDNYLEYSASGSARIELNGGTLKVGSQLRRGLTSSQGVLQYEQTGGLLQVGLNAAPNLNRGVFEIVNSNSRFYHTGGDIEIVRGVNSSNTPSLLIETSDYDLSATAEIQIGNGDTPSGAQSQQIGIKSNIPLKTLRVDNSSGNDPFVRLITYPLTVEELLEIDTDATFDCNGFDLTLLHDVTNNGTFESSGARLILQHSSSAQVGGSGTYNLAFLDKYGSGTTSVTTDLEIGEDLLVDAGSMNFGGNSCLLEGDATIDGNLDFTAPSTGLAFVGNEEQRLKRSSAGSSSIDIITIDNSLDVLVHPEGAGYEFTVNGDLRMVKGVFDLQGNLLELGLNANFVPVNGFGPSNMISTGGSFVPYGVKKQIPANTTTDYFVPLGFDTRFTPVRMNFSAGPDFSSGDQNCELLVRATEQPVSVLKSGEEANALQLYYTLEADNVGNGFKADAEFIYDDYYVSTIPPNTESDYVAARVLRPVPSDETQDQINVFGMSDVDESLNLIRFELYNTTEEGINGDYFAAVEDAILEDIAAFETINGGGPASDGDPNPNGTYDSAVLGGGAPTGAIVRVKSGHTLNLDIDGINFYRTIIESGAVVEIPSSTVGHRLGIVTGEGTIRLVGHGSIPAGTFNQFFNCTTGGTLEYAGTADYDIMGGLPTVRNLSLKGSGERRVANNNFTVCDLMLVEGTPSLEIINQNDRHITTETLDLVQGLVDMRNGDLTVEADFNMQGGSFTADNSGVREVFGDLIIDGGSFYMGDGGTVELKQDLIFNGGSVDGGGSDVRTVFNGSVPQQITGSLTGSNMLSALEIDNAAGLTINDPVDIERELYLTEGRIFTNSTAMLKFETDVNVVPEKGSSSSFVEGPMQWELDTDPTQRYFPVGRESWHRPFGIYSASAPRTWTVEYFNINPLSTPEVTSDLPADQVVVETVSIREYWRVNSNTASGTTARISMSWGDSSIVSSVPSEYNKLVVLGWDDGPGNWANYGGVEHGTWSPPNDVAEFNSEDPVPFTERILTLGSRDVANPLPVEFLFFRGEKRGDLNELTWATATETNNDRFVIERSLDGVHFNPIGQVNGAGNSSNINHYTFHDDSPPQKVTYYRLKQVDFDGQEDFADNVVVIDRAGTSASYGGVFYPNPARNGELKLELTGSDGRSSVVSFVDLSGRVMERHIIQPIDAQSQTISFITDLPAGVYIVEVRNSKQRFTSRVVIR